MPLECARRDGEYPHADARRSVAWDSRCDAGGCLTHLIVVLFFGLSVPKSVCQAVWLAHLDVRPFVRYVRTSWRQTCAQRGTHQHCAALLTKGGSLQIDVVQLSI